MALMLERCFVVMRTLLIVLVASVFSFAGMSAYADQKEFRDPLNGNLSRANNDQSIRQDLASRGMYPFIEVGMAAYYLQNPDLEIGTTGATTAPLVKVSSNAWTPMYNFGAGYHFFNGRDNGFTRIFGHETEVEAKFDYFSTSSSTNSSNIGLGTIWYIDGSGRISDKSVPINGLQLSTKYDFINLDLLFSYYVHTSNERLMLKPFFGPVFSRTANEAHYVSSYDAGAPPLVSYITKDLEDYQVNVNYYGLTCGGQLDFFVVQKMKMFSSLELQLVHAEASLTAHQNVDSTSAIIKADTRDVSSSDSAALTYRAIAMLGLSYQIFDGPVGPSLKLEVGLDHWGYNPKIVPPNHTGDKAVHLFGTTQNNAFIGLGVTVPFR